MSDIKKCDDTKIENNESYEFEKALKEIAGEAGYQNSILDAGGPRRDIGPRAL